MHQEGHGAHWALCWSAGDMVAKCCNMYEYMVGTPMNIVTGSSSLCTTVAAILHYQPLGSLGLRGSWWQNSVVGRGKTTV